MKVLATSYGFFVYGEKIYEDEKTIVFKDCEVYYRDGKIDKFPIFKLVKNPITRIFEVEKLFSLCVKNGTKKFICSVFEKNENGLILYGVRGAKGFIPLVRFYEKHYKIEGDFNSVLLSLSKNHAVS